MPKAYSWDMRKRVIAEVDLALIGLGLLATKLVIELVRPQPTPRPAILRP